MKSIEFNLYKILFVLTGFLLGVNSTSVFNYNETAKFVTNILMYLFLITSIVVENRYKKRLKK